MQRSAGNAATVEMLQTMSAPDATIQRVGGSVKDRLRFFEGGGSSLEQTQGEKPLLPKNGRMFSFDEAMKVFQDVETSGIDDSGPGTDVSPPPTPGSDLAEKEEDVVVEDTPDVDTDEEPDTGPRSLAGGEWRGRALHSDYRKERKGYDKSTGLAYASWVTKGPTHVKYLTKAQRADYELKLVKQNGVQVFFLGDRPIDTDKMKRSTFFKEDAANALDSGSGNVIFAMDVEGHVYVADEGAEAHAGGTASGTKWRFNHSSFVKGKPVAAAGEMWFKDGALTAITDNSGHYKPDLESMLQLLRNFKANGVKLEGVKVQLKSFHGVGFHDAEELLASGPVDLTLTNRKKAVNALDNGASRANLAQRADDLTEATAALTVANRQSTGLKLSAELARAVELLVGVGAELRREAPSLYEGDGWIPAESLWAAVSDLDDLEPDIFTTDAYQAAEKLGDEARSLFDDSDDRDVAAAAALLDELLAGTSVEAAKAFGSGADEQVPLDELQAISKDTKEYVRRLNGGTTALEDLRDKARQKKIIKVLEGADLPMSCAVLRNAAKQLDAPLDEVVGWFAASGPVAPHVYDTLARLVPDKMSTIKKAAA